MNNPSCLYLTILVLSTVQAVWSTPTSVELHAQRLLQDDRSALVREVLQWKKSPHAVEAEQLGVLPTNTNTNTRVALLTSSAVNVSDAELWRFALSKATIASLSRAHPVATFSTDTPFALLTADEFKSFVSRSGLATLPRPLLSSTDTSVSPQQPPARSTRRRLADHFDWSELGCVARVKSQGSCGSCAYFAAAAALESARCIFQGGGLVELSEQYLVSCFPYGYGCGGAWPGRVIEWARSQGGVCLGADCPYSSGDTVVAGNCSALACTPTPVRAAATVEVAQTEDALVDAIATQPVAVTLAASDAAFQYYTGGVLEGCSSGAAVDHAVLAVGYGHDAGLYYRFKNSWGAWWGERGFFRLRRNVHACRLLDVAPTYPAST